MKITNELLTTTDVARVLNLSPEMVRFLERTGRLLARKTAGGVRIFERAEVERVLAERVRQRGGRASD